MKVIAMIPARMGSKRVKNKNLRLIDHDRQCYRATVAYGQNLLNDEIGVKSHNYASYILLRSDINLRNSPLLAEFQFMILTY